MKWKSQPLIISFITLNAEKIFLLLRRLFGDNNKNLSDNLLPSAVCNTSMLISMDITYHCEMRVINMRGVAIQSVSRLPTASAVVIATLARKEEAITHGNGYTLTYTYHE